MRSETYEKLTRFSGYIETEKLLKAGFTNRQIANFVEEGLLEKICHGHYWVVNGVDEKIDEYKGIEVCLSNPNAIICADSACFYHGLIQEEPELFSVSTSRSDRSVIKMNFPTMRHYVSEKIFSENCSVIPTPFGCYNIFDIDRSVCDCIRFKKDIEPYIFELIIDNFRESEKEKQQENRLLEYAKRLRMYNQAKKYF